MPDEQDWGWRRWRVADIAALLRVADVPNIAVATNLASAGYLVRALAPEGEIVYTPVTRP